MPSVLVICCNLRVPLTHRKADPFAIVAPGSPGLKRYLRFEIHLEQHLLTRQNRLVERHLEDRALCAEHLFAPVHRELFHPLIPDLRVVVVENSITHPPVRIFDGSRAFVHHAARLKRIEKEMIKHAVQGVLGVVLIPQRLEACKLISCRIHVDLHGVLYRLLPWFGRLPRFSLLAELG